MLLWILESKPTDLVHIYGKEKQQIYRIIEVITRECLAFW